MSKQSNQRFRKDLEKKNNTSNATSNNNVSNSMKDRNVLDEYVERNVSGSSNDNSKNK